MLQGSVGHRGVGKTQFLEAVQAPQTFDAAVSDLGGRQIQDFQLGKRGDGIHVTVIDGATAEVELAQLRQPCQLLDVVPCQRRGNEPDLGNLQGVDRAFIFHLAPEPANDRDGDFNGLLLSLAPGKVSTSSKNRAKVVITTSNIRI